MSDMNEPTADFWNTLSGRYERLAKRYKLFSLEWIRKHAHEIEGLVECRVLDLGCGTGLNVKLLCEQRSGIRADGIDISDKMLEHARTSGKYERLCAQDLDKPPLEAKADTYDLVIAFGFIEFLSDLDVCLSECHRVLKTNGILWASFQRHESGDAFSPPRTVGKSTGYSASEILYIMSILNMRVTDLEALVGWVTTHGFAVPYYVLQARKMS